MSGRRWPSDGPRALLHLASAVLLVALQVGVGNAPAGAQQNLVANGSFEQPPADSLKEIVKGESFGGWTVDPNTPGRGVEHVGTQWQAASGQQSVHLASFDVSAIYQDVPTTPGQTYRLRFAMSGATYSGSAGPVKRMEVRFGDIARTFEFDIRDVPGGHSAQNMGWRYSEFDVVATAPTTRLRFASLNPGAGDGPVVDDVSLTPPGQPSPTPAPSPTPTVPPGPPPAQACPPTAPFFPETGFCIDQPQIQAYFNARGQVDIFGFPVSRTFTLLGCQVQIFQRQVAQVCAGQGPAFMNILDPDIFPFTQLNFSTFPAVDEALKNATPQVGAANYPTAILDFVRANAPDTFEGVPVNFEQTFFSLITPAQAGTSDPGLLGLINLEAWGAPISRPMRDPNNPDFVYQRFQRGIMHHIASQGVTRGILLADALKQLMRDSPELPPDLRAQAQAQGSRFFAQYCPGSPGWLCRPAELPGTDLTAAFETS